MVNAHFAERVGRIILAYGALDLQMVAQIVQLQLGRAMHGGTQLVDAEQFPGQFNDRLKLYRRLCVELSCGDKRLVSDVDRLVNAARRLADERALFAHGRVHEEENVLRVVSERAYSELVSQAHDFFMNGRMDEWSKRLHCLREGETYDTDRLTVLDNKLREAKSTFAYIAEEAITRFRERDRLSSQEGRCTGSTGRLPR